MSCSIFLETEPFEGRGWCFCRVCLHPFHKTCLKQYIDQGRSPSCPSCRAAIHNMTETFNNESANEPTPNSSKACVKVSCIPFPTMAQWLSSGHPIKDFPADEKIDIPWPNELAENMEARRTTELDVDDDFWAQHSNMDAQ